MIKERWVQKAGKRTCKLEVTQEQRHRLVRNLPFLREVLVFQSILRIVCKGWWTEMRLEK